MWLLACFIGRRVCCAFATLIDGIVSFGGDLSLAVGVVNCRCRNLWHGALQSQRIMIF